MKQILRIAYPSIPAEVSAAFCLFVGPLCFDAIGRRLQDAAADSDRPGSLILISITAVVIIYVAAQTRRGFISHWLKSRRSLRLRLTRR